MRRSRGRRGRGAGCGAGGHWAASGPAALTVQPWGRGRQFTPNTPLVTRPGVHVCLSQAARRRAFAPSGRPGQRAVVALSGRAAPCWFVGPTNANSEPPRARGKNGVHESVRRGGRKDSGERFGVGRWGRRPAVPWHGAPSSKRASASSRGAGACRATSLGRGVGKVRSTCRSLVLRPNGTKQRPPAPPPRAGLRGRCGDFTAYKSARESAAGSRCRV